MIDTQLVDKKLVASSFESSAATYEENAIVQKEISGQLISLLERYGVTDYKRVFEIGCCTGVLTGLICSVSSVDSLYVNDIVEEFCSITQQKVEGEVGDIELCPGDIEAVEFPTALDLVISSSTFQWMSDLPRLFNNISCSLQSKAHLAFTIFGPGTMTEIAQITGRSLLYYSEKDLLTMLEDQYSIISMHTETKCLYFPTVRAVLRHIQQTGVGGLGRAKWTKSRLRDFEQEYTKKFSSDFGVPVTYVSTFVLAEKV